MSQTGMQPGAALLPRIPDESVCSTLLGRFRRRWQRIAALFSVWRWKCAMRWRHMACG